MRPLNATVYGEGFAWVTPVGYLAITKVGAAPDVDRGGVAGGV